MLNIKIKVLVVDNFPISRKIMRTLLEGLGFEYIEDAGDGYHALKILQENNDFGLVLSECDMPVMNGVDLLKHVRGDESLKDLPFILITAKAEKDKIIEAIKAGVDNYILKPFAAEGLRERLNKVAQKRPSLTILFHSIVEEEAALTVF